MRILPLILVALAVSCGQRNQQTEDPAGGAEPEYRTSIPTFSDITLVTSAQHKANPPKWTEERRKKQGDAIRASFTEERRQRMSETMKKVRRERYWHSTGKSKRSQQP